EPLPGYRQLNPMVYCGLYPVNSEDYNPLRDALERLELNDAALQYEPETSQALGFGFRSGFLGLLHMEIIQELIEREFNIDLIITVSTVIYKVFQTNIKIFFNDNPSFMLKTYYIENIFNPFLKANIIISNDFVSPIMKLYQRKHQQFIHMQHLDDI